MSLQIKAEQIWVAQSSVDFRQSIDGLCKVIKEVDPYELLPHRIPRATLDYFAEQEFNIENSHP